MVFVNMFDSTDIKVENFPVALTQKYIRSIIKNDTLHLIDLEKKNYTTLSIDKDFKIRYLTTYSLNQFVDLKDWYILSLSGSAEPFHVSGSVLYIPYDINGGDNSNEFAYLKIDLSSKASSKIIRFPECYSTCTFYSESTSLLVKPDNVVYALFSNIHLVAKQTGSTYKEVVLPTNHYPAYFDRSKTKDLSYVRRHKEMIQSNLNIISARSGYIVIRKQFKSNITDSDRFELMFFSHNDNYQGSVQEEGVHYKSISYKAGILVLNDSLTKMSYYEF